MELRLYAGTDGKTHATVPVVGAFRPSEQ